MTDKPLKLSVLTSKKTPFVKSDIILEKIIRKIDWDSFNLCLTSLELSNIKKPDGNDIIAFIKKNEEWTNLIYDHLFGYDIINGNLICTNCNHVFLIKNGIPNMLLREDEV